MDVLAEQTVPDRARDGIRLRLLDTTQIHVEAAVRG